MKLKEKLMNLGYPVNWHEFWFCAWYIVRFPYRDIDYVVSSFSKIDNWIVASMGLTVLMLVAYFAKIPIMENNLMWFFIFFALFIILYCIKEIKTAKWREEMKRKILQKGGNKNGKNNN